MKIHEYDFELINVHMVGSSNGDYAEVSIRDKNGCIVYSGNIKKVEKAEMAV